MANKSPQDGPKGAQEAENEKNQSQEGPKRPEAGPKTAPRGPKTAREPKFGEYTEFLRSDFAPQGGQVRTKCAGRAGAGGRRWFAPSPPRSFFRRKKVLTRAVARFDTPRSPSTEGGRRIEDAHGANHRRPLF